MLHLSARAKYGAFERSKSGTDRKSVSPRRTTPRENRSEKGIDATRLLPDTLGITQAYGFSDSLGYLLSRCASRLAARFETELAPYDISLAQWGALLAINETGEASPSVVADRVGIDRGATIRLLSRMEAKGLVKRRSHQEDGRSVVFELSPETKQKLPELLALSKSVKRCRHSRTPRQTRFWQRLRPSSRHSRHRFSSTAILLTFASGKIIA
ncbi:MarR family winged helix-turn-helix transcriptional regulator [Roseobacter sinensis]|uniref:MarR family winged helix-turn-helix transcriptional regulator n=1 Tax=Roseobacter sinensis TaxID=2931391 RepID=UPI00384FB672